MGCGRGFQNGNRGGLLDPGSNLRMGTINACLAPKAVNNTEIPDSDLVWIRVVVFDRKDAATSSLVV